MAWRTGTVSPAARPVPTLSDTVYADVIAAACPAKRPRTTAGTTTFMIATASAATTVPGNIPPVVQIARITRPSTNAAIAASTSCSSPSRRRSPGPARAARPKQSTGTVTSSDCPAVPNPRSARIGGIPETAKRRLNASRRTATIARTGLAPRLEPTPSGPIDCLSGPAERLPAPPAEHPLVPRPPVEVALALALPTAR